MPLRAARPEPVKFVIADFTSEAEIKKCFDGTLFGKWELDLEIRQLTLIIKDPDGCDDIVVNLAEGDMLVLRGGPVKGLAAVFEKNNQTPDENMVTIHTWDFIRSGDWIFP